MTTAAIAVLKQEEAQQNEKLQALIQDTAAVIQEGDRAREAVAAQERHCAELVSAIITLEKQASAREGGAL